MKSPTLSEELTIPCEACYPCLSATKTLLRGDCTCTGPGHVTVPILSSRRPSYFQAPRCPANPPPCLPPVLVRIGKVVHRSRLAGRLQDFLAPEFTSALARSPRLCRDVVDPLPESKADANHALMRNEIVDKVCPRKSPIMKKKQQRKSAPRSHSSFSIFYCEKRVCFIRVCFI
jgi:hypothetical protein